MLAFPCTGTITNDIAQLSLRWWIFKPNVVDLITGPKCFLLHNWIIQPHLCLALWWTECTLLPLDFVLWHVTCFRLWDFRECDQPRNELVKLSFCAFLLTMRVPCLSVAAALSTLAPERDTRIVRYALGDHGSKKERHMGQTWTRPEAWSSGQTAKQHSACTPLMSEESLLCYALAFWSLLRSTVMAIADSSIGFPRSHWCITRSNQEAENTLVI